MLYWWLQRWLCCGLPTSMGKTMNEMNQHGVLSGATWKRGAKRTAFVGMLLLCLILLMSCAADGPARGVEFCSVAQPMYLDPVSHVVASDAEQILAYNNIGQHFCGWRSFQ